MTWISYFPDPRGVMGDVVYGPHHSEEAARDHARGLSTDPDEGKVAELVTPYYIIWAMHERAGGWHEAGRRHLKEDAEALRSELLDDPKWGGDFSYKILPSTQNPWRA